MLGSYLVHSLSVLVHQLKLIPLPPVSGWVARACQQTTVAVWEVNNLDKVIERPKLLLTIDEGEKIAAIETTERPH